MSNNIPDYEDNLYFEPKDRFRYNNKEEFLKQMFLPKIVYDNNYDSGEPNSLKRFIWLQDYYNENGSSIWYSIDRGSWLHIMSIVLGNKLLSNDEIDKIADKVSEMKYR